MADHRGDVILVSTADWDNPFWTNKQHVAVSLVNRGHRVFYIDSQGLRVPTLTGRDAKRIWRRLRRGFAPPRQVMPNLWVWSPLTLPLQGYGFIRAFNRACLRVSLAIWRRKLGLNKDILWSYSPLTPALYKTSGYGAVVYHAVDDIAAQPGMPVEAIAAGERAFLAQADLVFVTAPHLRDQHSAHHQAVHYFPNVADYDHFHRAMTEALAGAEDVANLPRPVIGFIGAISSYKIDFELLAFVAQARPEWSIVLIGAVGEGDPLTDPSMIEGLPNLHLLGPRSYQLLPSYLGQIDVAILPNRINDYTRAMFPMKFFEYLAAGRPVVATCLPALADYRQVAYFAKTPQDFILGIEAALSGNAPALDLRLAAAQQQTYQRRTEKMMDLVEGLLTSRQNAEDRASQGRQSDEKANPVKTQKQPPAKPVQ